LTRRPRHSIYGVKVAGAYSLADRILAEEHQAYSEAIARVASGRYEIQGRRYTPRLS